MEANKIPIARVVHCKRSPYDVYIGRPSKWGNPFSHKLIPNAKVTLVNTREEAVKAYRHYIMHGEGQHLLKDLHELKGKVLGCWCAPKQCHGDVLVELLDSLVTKFDDNHDICANCKRTCQFTATQLMPRRCVVAYAGSKFKNPNKFLLPDDQREEYNFLNLRR